ncbi:MAG TPA: DUF4282 domain-containing protein [Thermoleophilaceae bacterium]|nr:DUF4282 domain-containing protein [Thermoleophilaceae bacterium]
MNRGFLSSLFDISFRNLITPRIIRFLYVLVIIGIGIGALIGVIAGLVSLAEEPLAGVVILVAVPVASLMYLIYARVGLEIVIALFHVMQNTSELVRVGGGRPATSGTFVAPSVATGPPAAASAPPSAGGQPGEPGWHPDPQGKARLRYWDGSAWTEHTSD